MATPFDDYDTHTALEAIQANNTPGMAAAALFYAGDHWQRGDGYTGPRPQTNDPNYATVLTEIERQFVARNAIGEMVNRHRNGVAGRSPLWNVTTQRELPPDGQPTPEEQIRIDEAAQLLDVWSRTRKTERQMGEAVAASLYAGRGALRLFVPPAERNETGQIPTADLLASIQRIHIGQPKPAQAIIAIDEESQQRAGIYTYQRKIDQRRGNSELRVEMTYLDEEATILRILGEGAGDDLGAWALPLGGRLLLHEIERPPLITDPVMRQQRMLNLAKTMMQRNIITGGFLERLLLNAQMPGAYEKDDNGRSVFVPSPLHIGAGTTNFLVGVTTEDGQGGQRVATPDVRWRDPVSVDTFAATERSAYLSMLAETHQLHYAIAGDATPSGESRTVAMADYVIDLLTTKSEVDDAWSWLFETALAMAAVFAGQPGRYDDLMVVADAQIDPGPIGADMMRAVNELVRDRLLSADTGRSWIGVSDTQEEGEKIIAEQQTAAAGALSQIEGLIQNRVDGAA